MAGTRRRLVCFVLGAFAITAIAVLWQQSFDGILAVEEFQPAIDQAAVEAGLENPDLLAALVYAESRGNPAAVSSVGALGLCQLLPTTAVELALRHGISGPPWSPADNLRMGAHYLAELLLMFDHNVDLALLAYRLGPGRVSRLIMEAGSPSSYIKALRRRRPSAWEYRTQIMRFEQRFRERRLALQSLDEPS